MHVPTIPASNIVHKYPVGNIFATVCTGSREIAVRMAPLVAVLFATSGGSAGSSTSSHVQDRCYDKRSSHENLKPNPKSGSSKAQTRDHKASSTLNPQS